MLFHGTGKLGALRRVSCDLRFFPLCGFLPSETHILDARPIEAIHRQRARAVGPTRLDSALPHLLRFINTDLLEDPEAVFTQKFHNRQIHLDRLRSLRERTLSTAE